MSYFLEAYDDAGKPIGGLFAGRGEIVAKDYRRTRVYSHLRFAYDKDYPRYARVKFYEVKTSEFGEVVERFENRYYKPREKKT